MIIALVALGINAFSDEFIAIGVQYHAFYFGAA
jgi:hypothetical protein